MAPGFACSTPCGISGWAGKPSSIIPALSPSAQRLAASVVGQSSFLAMRSSSWLCSTPCGISGWADGDSVPLHRLGFVLNALRHQWLGSFDYQPAKRDCRVLNALRHQWLGRAGLGRDLSYGLCAQRLAASVVGQKEIASPGGVQGNDTHRQCSTPCGISGWAGLGVNATRIIGVGCSTPCGISGWAELWTSGLAPRTGVLNALRHQWLGRGNIIEPCVGGGECSTPCGISGWAELSNCRRVGLSNRAQRLAASVVGQQGATETRAKLICVLNALRHQWLGSLVSIFPHWMV